MSCSENEIHLDQLCNFISFIANSTRMFAPGKNPSPASMTSVLISILSYGTEIESLPLIEDPSSPSELARAIRQNDTLRRLSVSNYRAPCLIQMVTESFSPRLERLDLHKLEFMKIESVAIEGGFERCTGLRQLRICQCVFGSIQEIAQGIGKLYTLESVYLINNDVRGEGVRLLMEALNQLPNINELTIRKERLSTSGSAALGSFCGIGKLRALNLCNDSLSGYDFAVISAGLPSRCNLQTLNLRMNSIGSLGGSELADGIKHFPYLTTLNLSENKINSDAAAAISKELQSSRCLSSLDASGCCMQVQGVANLIEHMKLPLISLKLAQNSAGNLGVKFVSDFLCDSGGKLTELDLGDNCIDGAGAGVLVEGLAKASSLIKLVLKGNPIGPAGGVAVLNSIATPETRNMELVELQGCGIGDRGAEAMGGLLTKRGCNSVGLMNNSISGKGFENLASSVEKAVGRIHRLDLQDNEPGEHGLKFLAERVLRTNKVVREVYLDRCLVTDKAASALVDAVKGRAAGGELKLVRILEKSCSAEGLKTIQQSDECNGVLMLVKDDYTQNF